MPRSTIFGNLGFKPDPKGAKQSLLKSKNPFYSRVCHSKDTTKKRYAELNFPINKYEPVEMADAENPNLLDSVRHMSTMSPNKFSSFVKTSRLNVPAGILGPQQVDHEKGWHNPTPNAPDLSKFDSQTMLNSMNNFDTFINTKPSKSWTRNLKQEAVNALRSRQISRSQAFSATQQAPSNQVFDQTKVKAIRLEHFQNFKKLRRRMDRAYLRIRHIESKGGGRGQSEDDPFLSNDKDGDGPAKIVNPVYVESMKTYR